MSCGGCARKSAARNASRPSIKNNGDEVLGAYKYMSDRQIKARLELYKKRYCQACEKRYKCDIVMYTECKKISIK